MDRGERRPPGVKVQKGFYDYDAKGKRTRLWPGLFDYGGGPPGSAGKWRTDADPDELKLRLITIQALEPPDASRKAFIRSARCRCRAILGWGFAPYTGGPISMIDTSAAAFVQRCEALAASMANASSRTSFCVNMASKGETFYQRFARARKQPRAESDHN